MWISGIVKSFSFYVEAEMNFLKRVISVFLILVLSVSVFSVTLINAGAYGSSNSFYESIPETVYAITNEPVEIYYNNIISQPGMTVVFSASEDIEIDYYNKKVELSAKTPGDYNVIWRVYDNKYAFVESGVISLVVRNKNLKDMTVLVLGDSTVKPGTMTQEMLDLFKANGSRLRLLGSQGSGDNLHEGRGGWRSYDYCELQSKDGIFNPFYKSGFNFANYMKTQGYESVDAVVIQLGINDIKKFSLEDYSSVETFFAFDSIISSIKSYNKNISIIFSLTIPPNENPEVFEGKVGYAAPEEYRPNIIRFVAELMERYKNTENIYFSATNASINTSVEIKDVVHPTEIGYKQMAQTHIETLNFIMNKEIVSEPTRIISGFYEEDGVNLSWVPMANVAFYEVLRSDSAEVIFKTNDTSFKDASVLPGKNYQYVIRTHFNDGFVFDSKPCSVNVTIAPELISATNHKKGVKIVWNEVQGAEAYIVYRKNAASSWKKIGTVITNSFVDSKAVSGNEYAYTVKAKLNSGVSDYNKTGISCYYLATPKLSSAVNRNNFVQVKWKAVNGAEGYYIYRKTSKSGKWKKLAQVKGTAYTDKNVATNGNYFYTIRAYSGSTLSSYVSSGIATKYLNIPQLTKIATGTTGVTLNYGAVKGAKNYYIYRKTPGSSWKKIATVSGKKTYYLDKSAVKGTTYTYTVRAVNGKYLSYYNTKGLSVTDRY